MKENLTSINILLDGSGSMEPLINDTIGGVNKFLDEQKAFPGEALLSLHIFNTNCKTIHDCVPLAKVPHLDKKTYGTMGGTALLDAMGLSIDNLGKHFTSMKEEERPSKVLFLIITDGEENASHLIDESDPGTVTLPNGVVLSKFAHPVRKLRYPHARVKEMVEHQKGKYNWDFVFMGANIDTIAAGAAMGVAAGNTMSFNATAAGTADLYKSVSQSTTRYRSSGSSGSGFFTP